MNLFNIVTDWANQSIVNKNSLKINKNIFLVFLKKLQFRQPGDYIDCIEMIFSQFHVFIRTGTLQ